MGLLDDDGVSTGLLNSPEMLLAIGTGLLQGGAPGGTLGGGMQQGFKNYLQMGQAMRRNRLVDIKEAEYKRKIAQREAQQAAMARILGEQGRTIESPVFTSGENYQPATGMYATDPQMADLLSTYSKTSPDKALELYAGQLTPDRTGLYKNLMAAGLQPGTPEFEAAMMQAVNKPQTVVNNLPSPEKGFTYVDPTDPSKGVKPIIGGSRDPLKSKDYRTKVDKLGRVQTALDVYKNKLSQFGTEYFPGSNKLELSGSHSDLMLELKELFNLGVLQQADLEIMEKVVRDPTSLQNQIYSGKDLSKQLR